MVVPYVVVGNPNELAIVSGVGYSEPKFLNDGFAVVVACFHKVNVHAAIRVIRSRDRWREYRAGAMV